MTQEKLELFIRMRSQELYQAWCNDPDSSVADTIAKGMMDAVHYNNQQPVVGLEKTGDPYQDLHTSAKEGQGGVLEYLPDELTITGELVQGLRGLASSFVLSEEELLKHLLSMGKLVAATNLYIKDKNGNYVELGDIT